MVINWNYAAYVGTAIESVLRQDYANFECLVIDNGSSDDSQEVIARHAPEDPRFSVVHLPENLGQLGAAFWALERIKGGFVTFVDADDFLFSNFASTHLQVHLALPQSVALTSSNVVETDAHGRILNCSYSQLATGHEKATKGLRPAAQCFRLPEISEADFAAIQDVTVRIPRHVRGWLWAPGTANMFRRSVLDMVRIGDGTGRFMRALDGHFNRLCHTLAGSALIDTCLSGYRMHGGNDFAESESINGIRQGIKPSSDREAEKIVETTNVLIENADYFYWKLGDYYWEALDRLIEFDFVNFEEPRVLEAFQNGASKLLAAVGPERFVAAMFARFGRRRGLAILRRGFGGKLPGLVYRELARRRARRLLRIFRTRKS